MTAPALKAPNSDLVAVAWVRSIPELIASSVGVATELPADDAPIRQYGFVALIGSGGSPDPNVPIRRPVMTAQCWAAPNATGSKKAPWSRAAGIAEWIWQATYDRTLQALRLDLSGLKHGPAVVDTVTALSEPRRIYGDPSDFARFDVDLLFTWKAA